MKTFSKTVLSRLLRQQRREKGLTQDEVARRTGINRALIGRAENGKFIPSLEQLQALA